jgi:hypothetical protein
MLYTVLVIILLICVAFFYLLVVYLKKYVPRYYLNIVTVSLTLYYYCLIQFLFLQRRDFRRVIKTPN